MDFRFLSSVSFKASVDDTRKSFPRLETITFPGRVEMVSLIELFFFNSERRGAGWVLGLNCGVGIAPNLQRLL